MKKRDCNFSLFVLAEEGLARGVSDNHLELDSASDPGAKLATQGLGRRTRVCRSSLRPVRPLLEARRWVLASFPSLGFSLPDEEADRSSWSQSERHPTCRRKRRRDGSLDLRQDPEKIGETLATSCILRVNSRISSAERCTERRASTNPRSLECGSPE